MYHFSAGPGAGGAARLAWHANGAKQLGMEGQSDADLTCCLFHRVVGGVVRNPAAGNEARYCANCKCTTWCHRRQSDMISLFSTMDNRRIIPTPPPPLYRRTEEDTCGDIIITEERIRGEKEEDDDDNDEEK